MHNLYFKPIRILRMLCTISLSDEKRGGEELHTQSDSLFLNLRGWLEEYDTHDTGCALRFTVAEKILQSAKEMYLPQWLIEMCRVSGKLLQVLWKQPVQHHFLQ